MYKAGSIVRYIVDSVMGCEKHIIEFKRMLSNYENKDIPYAIMESVFYKIIRNEQGDKHSFVRSDIGRAWGLIEVKIQQQEEYDVKIKPKQLGQKFIVPTRCNTYLVEDIVKAALNDKTTYCKVVQLMLEVEGGHREPDHSQLRQTFYEVLFPASGVAISHTTNDLQRVWEEVQERILAGDTKVLPPPTVTTAIEEKTMAATTQETLKNTPHSTIEYVYGVDIETMDKRDIMASIVRVQEEIKDLKDVGVKSTFIDEEVTKLEKVIKRLVKQLDAA